MPKIGPRIRLPITESDTRINGRKTYLVKYGGRWAVGKFAREWYGWNFDGIYDAGVQVDCYEWEAVYEFRG